MDASNPAVERQTSISPADLELIGKDPSLLTETSRKMLALNMMLMHRRMSDPNIPIGQRQQWMDFLSKMGDVMPKANAVLPAGAGAGFSVQIVFNAPPQAAPTPAALVVDAEPTPLASPTADEQ